jgi:UDP-glucuronate decarboxylase
MRILVTGGAGFIGSHLCERLVEQGHDVVCLDNYFTGSKHNVQKLLGHHHFELIRHDVINYIDIECDQVYNLACPASPIHYQHDAVRTIHANVLGVTNMLELAKRTRARILQASTSEVYGDPQVHPQPETYWGHVNPIGPRSCYDEGKRVAETLMMDYHRQHGVDIRIARIFNTYGPRMAVHDGRVVSSFIVQALQGKPITVFGEGQQTRSFCFVSDMVEALIRLMGAEGVHRPVNLGNPEEFTIRQLAETVREITGSKSPIQKQPLPLDDPVQRQPDITLAQQLLGWSPTVPLRAGLAPTIAYFEQLVYRMQRGNAQNPLAERLSKSMPERLAAMKVETKNGGEEAPGARRGGADPGGQLPGADGDRRRVGDRRQTSRRIGS